MRMAMVLGVLFCAQGLQAQSLPELAAWRSWSRDTDAIKARPDPEQNRDGKLALRIEHSGKNDWALLPSLDLPVKPGELVELSFDLKVQGAGNAGPCLTTIGEANKTLDWMAGFRPVAGPSEWRTVRGRVLVNSEIKTLQPRIVGNGAATVWIANPNIKRTTMNASNLAEVSVQNAAMSVRFDPAKQTFTCTDRRIGQTWTQHAPKLPMVCTKVSATGNMISAEFLNLQDDQVLRMSAALDGDKPELLVSLSSSGELSQSLAFPGAFVTSKGQYLVLPMNEGISYPADDPAALTWGLVTYGGHGLCMPFFGATDGERGWMGIVQTADDADVKIDRTDGLNFAHVRWEGQRGEFGYTREIRLVLLDKGGHVAMAKRYREYARQQGLLKTFAEKRKDRPGVDKLLGAVNTWCWDPDAAPIAREMLDAGIDRILWSNQLKGEQIQKLNEMGVVTSRYDIYQDLMDPANFPKLRYTHPDWTTAGFPKDIILDRAGKPIAGWEIEEKTGPGMIPCAVLCDLRAPEYAIKRIGEDLKTHAYQSRFIDTTTAAPWRECYSPAHPMTRTQSRVAKMELLAVISDRYKLICGSETGHDAAVPYCDYFEGMMSLGPYRVEDSGRDMSRIIDEVPESISKFQLGEKYRLPLWELVYHDACVAQWYWGDYNNKLPAVWKKRDQFNALYATPPMFMFNRAQWAEKKAQFVESYKASAAITRATAGVEMTDHRFLKPDRSVQQTAFANGVKVTVNFGAEAYVAGAQTIAPGAIHVEGLP